MHFDQAASDTSIEAKKLKRFKAISQRLKDIKTEERELREEAAELVEQVKKSVGYQWITKETDIKLRHQIQQSEAVHKQDNEEVMTNTRLGDNGNTNKRCLGRLVEIEGGKFDVSNTIFISMHTLDTKDGVIRHQDIPGDIEMVKNRPVAPFVPPAADDEKAVVAIFYSITTNPIYMGVERGGGRELAAKLHETLRQEAQEKGYNLYMSTLSPVRAFFENDSEFKQHLQNLDINNEDEVSELRLKTLKYLMENRNDVMNFHLGNGAYIADIKFNPGNKTDPVMVNYMYPADPEQLEANKKLYKLGVRPIAPHLYAELQREERELLPEADIVLGKGGSHNPAPFEPEQEITPHPQQLLQFDEVLEPIQR